MAHDFSTIYVSQITGNNLFDGFHPEACGYNGGPVPSVKRALERISEARDAGDDRPYTVAFADDYFMDETLVLSRESIAGRRGRFEIGGITFTSLGGRKTIYGAKKLTGWKESVFNGRKCICACVDKLEDGSYPRLSNLYVNGKRADMTRFPLDGGTLRVLDTEFNDYANYRTHSKWFIAKKEDLKDIVGIERAIVSFNHYWVDEHSPIESYDAESGKVTLKYRTEKTICTQYDCNNPSEFEYYLENLASAFVKENQWYYDESAGTVYYIPRADVTAENIEAYYPVTDKLFVIEGGENDLIYSVNFENIAFKYTKCDYLSYPRGAEEQFASDNQSVNSADSAVTYRFAHDCRIRNCELSCVGIYALTVDRGCHNVRIENNDIHDVAAGGIIIRGRNDENDKFNETYGITITRNKIHDLGQLHAAGCGILLMHSHDDEISYNEIHDLTYSGVSLGWVWGYRDSVTRGITVRGNHIYNIGTGGIMSDMGGVYTLGKQKGTVIEENVIHDVFCKHYGAFGLYTDEGSSYITLRNNVVYNTQSESYHLHFGRMNILKDNVFAFGGVKRDNYYACGSILFTRSENHMQAAFEGNVFIQDGLPIVCNAFYYTTLPNMVFINNKAIDVSGREPFAVGFDNKEYGFIELLEKIGINNGNTVGKLKSVDFTEVTKNFADGEFVRGFIRKLKA